MPTHTANAAAPSPFQTYCHLIGSLASLPASEAAPIAERMRVSLNLTPAEHCEATALVFSGVQAYQAPARAQPANRQVAVKARPAARPAAPKPGQGVYPPAAGGAATDPLLLQRVSVYWPEYSSWFEGVVVDVDAAGQHLTLYPETKEEFRCNLHAWTDGMKVLGPASPQLLAQLAAYGWGPAAATAAAPLAAPVAAVAGAAAAAPNQLRALSWEQLEVKLNGARSANTVNAIENEVALRTAAIQAQLAALGESEDEME